MFESLSNRLNDVFDRLRRHGALSEDDVNAALREIRIALLEADVALPVVKDFVNGVREKALGQEVLRSVTPAQMVVKIVHDHLVEMLGGASADGLDLNAVPPVVVMMVGLQGSGKTTTSAKLARLLRLRERKKVLLVSLDVQRPAAQEQLAVLARQVEVACLPIRPGERPIAIAQRALDVGRREGYDVVILDTAGRLHIDEPLMLEVAAVRDATHPTESLLVADAMTGQDSVNVARSFAERVGLTGIVLTRVDGDARGGAALSMRAVTGRPIKFMGTGEKLDALEPFHAERVAGRIIGMLPGINKIKKQLDGAKIDDGMIKRQEAIISSMTKSERKNPKLLNASRRRRIATGSGTSVPEINRLLKQFQDMASMMKKMNKLGKKGLMRHGISGLLPGGGGFGR